ncbi:MAG: ATP synthase F0 subunit B [Burkholderiales bacterium]
MLDVDWSFPLAFLSVLIFLVLMHKIFFKPLRRHMEQREKRIDDDLAEGARLRQQAEAALTTYQTVVATARREAVDQTAATQRAMEAKQREIVEGARGEAATLVADAQATLAREAEETRARLATEAHELARLVAAKLVGR